jgi:hypothetical protein
MLPFGEASLKPITTMKTYITPTIECNSFVGAMLMYTPSDSRGSGALDGPGTPDPESKTF